MIKLFSGSELAALVVEENIAFNPVYISLLRALAVMLHTDALGRLVE